MDAWYFSYGISTLPSRFQEEVGKVSCVRPASIADHRLAFANYKEAWGGGTSCIIPEDGRTALGTAYLVSHKQLELLEAGAEGYGWQAKVAIIEGLPVPVKVLLPNEMRGFAMPADHYVARIREGLSYFYSMLEIDRYLRESLDRSTTFSTMKAQWHDLTEPNREYGIEFRRLFPWKGVVRTPWGAAWGSIAPGSSTELFTHDEEEVAFVTHGVGEARINHEKQPIKQGDVLYFEPDSEHVLTNTSQNVPLEVIFLWWGGSDGTFWAGRRL